MTANYPRMPNGDLVTKEKNAGLAVLLGIFIPGAGVMYAGRVGLGLLFLLAPVSMLLGVFILLTVGSITSAFAILILIPITNIYAIYLGYAFCKQNNELWYTYLEKQVQ